MLTDNSKYKKQHNEVISYVRKQIEISPPMLIIYIYMIPQDGNQIYMIPQGGKQKNIISGQMTLI